MKTAHYLFFLLGIMVGGIVTVLFLELRGQGPVSYREASVPAIMASGQDTARITAKKLSLALNPCIVDGILPDECKMYVANGVVTQPPIKIVVDTSK